MFEEETHPCPECGTPMNYTGMPDLAGPVKFQFDDSVGALTAGPNFTITRSD